MAVYLVTYDLNKETVRPPIVEKIGEIADGWARLSESSYAINYAGTPEDVYAALKPLLDSNDHLYVITLNRPYTGYGPTEVNEWLEANLPKR
ncbi:MAG TPA: hypothetical protein VNQ97_10855 [Burkholderiaceae bacterium]|nr:hypothetical protein [Burkholderiaceae bacterium]